MAARLRFNTDVMTGIVTAGAGSAYWLAASQLPSVPALGVMPGLFPTIIAGFLIGTGSLLVLRGLAQDRARPQEPSFDEAAAEELGLPAQERAVPLARRALRLGAVFAAVVFYILAVEPLGFAPTAAIASFAVALAFGASVKLALVSAVVSTFVFSLVFGTLLRVPLPPSFLSDLVGRAGF